MNDRDVLFELQQQHGIRVKFEDDCQLPGWAECMIANALQQPDFRATAATALRELRGVFELKAFERKDYYFIWEVALDELNATIAKLGLADEAQEEKR